MKPGIFVKVTPASDGATEKITELFMERAEVSFMRDIAPALFEEHQYKVLDMRVCTEASEEVERALDIVRNYGRVLKCVPQFQPRLDGTLCVSDMIYKQEKLPIAEYIKSRMEEDPHCRECICRSCDLFQKDGCLEGADHCVTKCDHKSHTRACPWHPNERGGGA